MYDVVLTEQALKALGKIPAADVRVFWQKVDIIAADPYASIGFAKRLKASPYFRFRFGNYRCVYGVVDKTLTITIIEIGDRKEIYRR